MSKYDSLGIYLRNQPTSEVPMSFAEIEQVTGVPLPPKSQNYAAWWSNNPANNVMTRIWLAAGFKTERVDLSSRRLVFRRVKGAAGHVSPDGQNDPQPLAPATVRHPILGALKGYVRIAPGVDLTEPADPSWGENT